MGGEARSAKMEDINAARVKGSYLSGNAYAGSVY